MYVLDNEEECRKFSYIENSDIEIVRRNTKRPYERAIQIYLVQNDGNYYEIARNNIASQNKYWLRFIDDSEDVISEEMYKNSKELKEHFLLNLNQLEQMKINQLNIMDNLIDNLGDEHYLEYDDIEKSEQEELEKIFDKARKKQFSFNQSNSFKQYMKDIFGDKENNSGKKTKNYKRYSFAKIFLEYMEKNYDLSKEFMDNLNFTANSLFADSISIKDSNKNMPLINFRDEKFFLYDSNGKEHTFNKNNIKDGFEKILDEKLKFLGINKKQNIDKVNKIKEESNQNTIRKQVNKDNNEVINDDRETMHETELNSEYSKEHNNVELSSATKIVDIAEDKGKEEEEVEKELDDLDSGIISKRNSMHDAMLSLGDVGVASDNKNNKNLQNISKEETELDKGL